MRRELDRLRALLGREFENRQFRSRLVLHVRLHAEDDFFRASKRLHAWVAVVLDGKIVATRDGHFKTQVSPLTAHPALRAPCIDTSSKRGDFLFKGNSGAGRALQRGQR